MEGSGDSLGTERRTTKESNREVFPIGPPHPSACVVCRDAVCLRLVLRNCGHIVCVACFLCFLQGQIHLKAKVAPRCPSGWCAREVHENDMRAVFDEKEEGLDVFMTPEQRQYLQYCHDKDSIVLALAGPNWKDQDELIRRCPLCKNIYYRRNGCNSVVCPNLRCKTNFCWQCAKPIRGIGHFAGGTCRVAFDDIARATVVLRMADEVTTWAVFLGVPVAFLFFHIVMPLIVFFAFPFYAAKRFYVKATETSDFLTPEEWILVVVKMILGAIVGTVIGLPVALGSIFTGACFQCIYMTVLCWKWTGCMSKVLKMYDRLLPFAACLGLSHVKEMLKEGREQKAREILRREDVRQRELMEEASVVREP